MKDFKFIKYNGYNVRDTFYFLEGHERVAATGENFYIDFEGVSTFENGILILKQSNEVVNAGDFIVKNNGKFKVVTQKMINEYKVYGIIPESEELKGLIKMAYDEMHEEELSEFLSLHEGRKTPTNMLNVFIPEENPFLVEEAEDKKENSIDYENLSLEEKMEIIKSMFKYVSVHQDREGYKNITITIDD